MKVNIWVGDESIETNTEMPVPATQLHAMRERQNLRDAKTIRVSKPSGQGKVIYMSGKVGK